VILDRRNIKTKKALVKTRAFNYKVIAPGFEPGTACLEGGEFSNT
jgi:hypothetical protein